MNLVANNLRGDNFRQGILVDEIVSGSEESREIRKLSEEVLRHVSFPYSMLTGLYGTVILRRVKPKFTTLAATAKNLFPKHRELTIEEAKEIDKAFLSFFE